MNGTGLAGKDCARLLRLLTMMSDHHHDAIVPKLVSPLPLEARVTVRQLVVCPVIDLSPSIFGVDGPCRTYMYRNTGTRRILAMPVIPAYQSPPVELAVLAVAREKIFQGGVDDLQMSKYHRYS